MFFTTLASHAVYVIFSVAVAERENDIDSYARSVLARSVLVALAIWLRLPPILASCRKSSGSAVLTVLGCGISCSKQVFLIQTANSPFFCVVTNLGVLVRSI